MCQSGEFRERQYGFIPECGTTDYGAALTFTIQDCLQRRRQGILIPMIKKLGTKARQRIGALYRIRHLLNPQNLKTIYMMLIRSIMEYNSVCWMGAAQSHLNSLDRVQHTAERMCGFAAEPLQARRDAATMALALKLLDGKARGDLKNFVPRLIEPLRLCKKRTRQVLEGTQVIP